MVHAHYKQDITRRGRGGNNPFDSILEVGPDLLQGSEVTSRLQSRLGTSIVPSDVDGILFLEDGDPIDDKLPTLGFHCAVDQENVDF